MEAFIATSSTVEQGEVVELAAESIPDLEDSDQEDTRTTLRLIDTELLDLAEKQRKRSKNWSTSGRHDLEVGDIHHQPVITLMFLITTILATTVISFMTGATLLALGFGVMLSLMFVGAARLRANEIGLRLPDIMGIEAPIAVGMAGLVLIHVAGRASNSVVELDSTAHLLVLLIGLLMLSGLGLIGRNDLGLRLPNALEGVVFLALLDRVVCLLIGGEVPIPFATDPFATLGAGWTVPLVGVETILIGAVLGFDWVEGKRIKKNMADHRGPLDGLLGCLR